MDLSSYTEPGVKFGNNLQSSAFDMESNNGSKTLAVYVEGACKEYLKGVSVLNQFNMRVEKGSIYGLLGSSGCGKTTILSCMIGLRRLDSGIVRIFGKQPGDPDSGIPGKVLGYMPQEIALFQTFKIEEILTYFGRLYGMTQTEIKAETEFLINFLDLPDSRSLINNLSGGQQRRTSLAVAMLHKPDLLILDEPTVGVDPLIRESIWQHLKDLVAKRNTTILITTHYIEEAKESGTVGVMRNGRLLVEKSPRLLLEEHNAVLLETVVLKLCEKDSGESHEPHVRDNHQPRPTMSAYDKNMNAANRVPTYNPTPRRKFNGRLNLKSHITKILSLVVKNYTHLFRTPWFPIVLILIPTLHLFIFNAVLGNEPKNTKLGIVNKELPLGAQSDVMEFCKYQANECLSNFTSCKYLESFPKEVISWMSYTSEEEALKGIQKGDLWGYITVPENYTSHLRDRVVNGRFSESETLNGSEFGVALDMSDLLKNNFIQEKLYYYLNEYAKQIATECDAESASVEVPLKFRSTYGEGNPGYIDYIRPSQLSLVIFILPMACALTFIGDRKSGVLDRSLVAGVQHFHVLISYLVSEGSMIFMQLALSFTIYYFVWDFRVKGSFFLYWAMTYMQGIVGLSIGFFIAILCDHEIEAVLTILAIYLPMMVTSGAVWPLIGLSSWANLICSLVPITWPMESMRSIISRGWGISHPYIWRSFAVCFGWIIMICLLCSLVLRFKRH